MEKIICKKSFRTSPETGRNLNFIKDEIYFCWTNFGGLNYFVSDKEYSKDNKNILPFGVDKTDPRPYLYDYFYTKEEMRDIKINKIVEC